MAIDEEIERYEKLIQWVLNRYFPQYAEDEDMFQLGRIAVWRAIETWEEEGGASFKTYAAVLIKREILSELKKMGRMKNPDIAVSLDEEVKAGKRERADHTTYGDMWAKQEFEYVDLKGFAESLKRRKRGKHRREIFELLVLGYSLPEISVKLGISVQRVSQIRKEMRKEIEEYI